MPLRPTGERMCEANLVAGLLVSISLSARARQQAFVAVIACQAVGVSASSLGKCLAALSEAALQNTGRFTVIE